MFYNTYMYIYIYIYTHTHTYHTNIDVYKKKRKRKKKIDLFRRRSIFIPIPKKGDAKNVQYTAQFHSSHTLAK